MITGRQVRAARALLFWTQEILADKAPVALTALKRLESERELRVHDTTRDLVRRALEKAGILFIDSDRGHGVMLLNERPKPSRLRSPPRGGQSRQAGIPACEDGRKARSLEMDRPPLDPSVDDVAPTAAALTGYDQQHLVTYLRLLDAEAEGAHWEEVARIVLHIDPAREPDRARRAWESHLARARWMTQSGYAYLLRGGAPH